MPTRTQIKAILRQRISSDDPTNFNSAIWDKVRLGVYYDEDEELVDIIVYETTAYIAGVENRFIPEQVWRNLISKVNPNNTPDEAVDPMLEAALRAELVPEGQEPPAVNRPKIRPTLRSARKQNS